MADLEKASGVGGVGVGGLCVLPRRLQLQPRYHGSEQCYILDPNVLYMHKANLW